MRVATNCDANDVLVPAATPRTLTCRVRVKEHLDCYVLFLLLPVPAKLVDQLDDGAKNNDAGAILLPRGKRLDPAQESPAEDVQVPLVENHEGEEHLHVRIEPATNHFDEQKLSQLVSIHKLPHIIKKSTIQKILCDMVKYKSGTRD